MVVASLSRAHISVYQFILYTINSPLGGIWGGGDCNVQLHESAGCMRNKPNFHVMFTILQSSILPFSVSKSKLYALAVVHAWESL
jgi:hypothetical protein